MTPEKLSMSTTTDGSPPRPGFEGAPAPGPINHTTGQHDAYWVLSEQERAKGFVRPVRKSYKHIGIRPKYPLRDLTSAEKAQYHAQFGWIKFEAYPEGSTAKGKFWSNKQLESGCGGVTLMNSAIAETYARQPNYYGATMCVVCGAHFPVGPDGEFVWMDGDLETTERVGA